MSTHSERLAIVTGELAPDLSDGGKRLAAALADRGIESTPVMWNDPSVDWNMYDGVLLRSCWDYPDDVSRFQDMLTELERASVQVCNPLHVVEWNLHKSYVPELGEAGVPIPETSVIEQGTDISLGAIFEAQQREEIMIKPAIGAMSSQVWRASASDLPAVESKFSEQVANNDVLVQEFMPEITSGERSAVFFEGEYSHAWNSHKTENDITEFDGADADYEPPAHVQQQAGDVVQTACRLLGMEPDNLPYARVDYVRRGDELILMELELIEPNLGFDRGKNTIERFAETLAAYFESPT